MARQLAGKKYNIIIPPYCNCEVEKIFTLKIICRTLKGKYRVKIYHKNGDIFLDHHMNYYTLNNYWLRYGVLING